MNGRALLIGVLLPVLAGCFSYTMPLAYTNTSIADTKKGQDCKVQSSSSELVATALM
jgi:hypothetical protein